MNALVEQQAAHPLAPVMAGAIAEVPASPREFLSFRLGAEEYGIDILRVQEIRSYEAPTRIANAPDFIKGVIDLRGVIVPVIDLRLKFGLEEAGYGGSTVVIVLNLWQRVVGVVVDAVSDVLQLAPEQIRPAPSLSAALVDTRYIIGIAPIEQRMLILADIEGLMAGAEMGLKNAA